MNTSLIHDAMRDLPDDRLIERLVDGELAEDDRRRLLLRLESQPGGWRRCALAFLEAQTLRESVRGGSQELVPLKPVPKQPGNRRYRAVGQVAWAAGLLMAFVMGWISHPDFRNQVSPVPIADAQEKLPAVQHQQSEPAPIEDTRAASRPVPAPTPPRTLNPLVKQWEQRGFHADAQTRMVSMELKDGRKMNLPVHEVRLRYIGDRTY